MSSETMKVQHLNLECTYGDCNYNWAIICVDSEDRMVLIQELNRDADMLWVSIDDLKPAKDENKRQL